MNRMIDLERLGLINDDYFIHLYHLTVEKIRKYIEPLQNINFDNLVNAFQKLKDAITPLTSKLFEGLSWVYFNILVPLAQWTIEDVLPAFLNIFSGALNILNTAIEDFEFYTLEVGQENRSLQYQLEQKGEVIEKLNGKLSAKEKIINKLQEEKESLKEAIKNQ